MIQASYDKLSFQIDLDLVTYYKAVLVLHELYQALQKTFHLLAAFSIFIDVFILPF